MSKRILVVDDDFVTNSIACAALSASGYEPIAAFDARSALAKFEEARPDAMLLDINMPEIDGYAVCTQIRDVFADRDIPILVITANEDLKDIERAFEVGATDFMTKPINLALLPYRVQYMLRAADNARGARLDASRMAQAQTLARITYWHVEADGSFHWSSDPLAVFAPDLAIAGEQPSLVELAHPADRHTLERVLDERRNHELEYRLRLSDGRERVVHQAATFDGQTLTGVTVDVTDARATEERLVAAVYRDELTGVGNGELLRRYLDHCDDTPRSAIAIALGLEQHAHLSPKLRDALIQMATERISSSVADGDVVARTADQELVVVTSSDAVALARNLERVMAWPFEISSHRFLLPARFGVATSPTPIGKLVAAARRALADVPSAGGLVVYTDEMRARDARRVAMADLLETLDDREGQPVVLAVGFEPRFDAAGSIVALRAMPTWADSSLDVRELHDICRDSDLHTNVALWCIGQLATSAVGTLPVAVEMPCEFLASPGAAERIEQLLARTGFDRLQLELVDPPEYDEVLDRAAATATRLRERGVGIRLGNVDDHCSLRVVRRLPISAMRLSWTTLAAAPGLFEAIANMARLLGLEIAITDLDSADAVATAIEQRVNEISGPALADGLGPARVARN